jgi:hypothetical protein
MEYVGEDPVALPHHWWNRGRRRASLRGREISMASRRRWWGCPSAVVLRWQWRPAGGSRRRCYGGGGQGGGQLGFRERGAVAWSPPWGAPTPPYMGGQVGQPFLPLPKPSRRSFGVELVFLLHFPKPKGEICVHVGTTFLLYQNAPRKKSLTWTPPYRVWLSRDGPHAAPDPWASPSRVPPFWCIPDFP